MIGIAFNILYVIQCDLAPLRSHGYQQDCLTPQFHNALGKPQASSGYFDYLSQSPLCSCIPSFHMLALYYTTIAQL